MAESGEESLFFIVNTHGGKNVSPYAFFFAHIDAAPARHSSVIWTALCDFAGFKLGFEELEDAARILVAETAFRVVELGKGREGIQLDYLDSQSSDTSSYVSMTFCNSASEGSNFAAFSERNSLS